MLLCIVARALFPRMFTNAESGKSCKPLTILRLCSSTPTCRPFCGAFDVTVTQDFRPYYDLDHICRSSGAQKANLARCQLSIGAQRAVCIQMFLPATY